MLIIIAGVIALVALWLFICRLVAKQALKNKDLKESVAREAVEEQKWAEESRAAHGPLHRLHHAAPNESSRSGMAFMRGAFYSAIALIILWLISLFL